MMRAPAHRRSMRYGFGAATSIGQCDRVQLQLMPAVPGQDVGAALQASGFSELSVGLQAPDTSYSVVATWPGAPVSFNGAIMTPTGALTILASSYVGKSTTGPCAHQPIPLPLPFPIHFPTITTLRHCDTFTMNVGPTSLDIAKALPANLFQIAHMAAPLPSGVIAVSGTYVGSTPLPVGPQLYGLTITSLAVGPKNSACTGIGVNHGGGTTGGPGPTGGATPAASSNTGTVIAVAAGALAVVGAIALLASPPKKKKSRGRP